MENETKTISPKVFRFAVVGAVSTALDLLVLKLLLFLGVQIYLATAVGFLTGLVNGFLMNSSWVFNKDVQGDYFFKYGVVSLFGLLWTELIIHYLHVEAGYEALSAKLVAVVIVFFWNYLLSKAWAFK